MVESAATAEAIMKVLGNKTANVSVAGASVGRSTRNAKGQAFTAEHPLETRNSEIPHLIGCNMHTSLNPQLSQRNTNRMEAVTG